MAQNGSDYSGPQVMAPPVDVGSRAMVTAAPAPPVSYAAPGFAPRGPEILVGGFNQTWLVNCLRRRWLMALLMGLFVGGMTAAFLMWLFPESTRITALLEIRAEDASSPFEDTKRPVNHLEIQRQAAMHPALIKSSLVLEDALFKQDIAQLEALQVHEGDELNWMMDELKVNFAAESPLLEISYEGDESKEDMVKVIDEIVKSYKAKVLSQDALVRTTTRDDLQAVLVTVQANLEKKLGELKDLESVRGSTESAEFEVNKLRGDITMFGTQVMRIEEAMMQLEAEKEVALLLGNSASSLDTAVQAEVDKDTSINMYKEQMFQLDLQIQQHAAMGRNAASAQLKQLQTSRAQLEQMMLAQRMKVEKEARDRLSKIPNEAVRATVTDYNVKMGTYTKQLEDLKGKVAAAETRIKELAVVDPELEMRRQEIESMTALASDLDLEMKKGDVERQADIRRVAREGDGSEFQKVRVIQSARPVEGINFYERWAIAGIGGLAAFALTAYAVALLDFRRRRLNGAGDMDEGLGVRVLGVLPSASLKSLGGNSLVATQVAEGIDNVRATIMHDSTSRPRQVVLVTSPGTMEGATTVASSLAISLARAGRRTLLIDGDLRAPDLHKLFGLPLEDGLSEVLRSEVDLADAIRPTHNEGLHLLTAGVCDMDAIHALATDQPQAIFDKLRDQFDFIVIDAPPVLGISDALSLGQYVDGCVLTVLRDHSEVRMIYQAIEVLRSMGVRIIGSVVNGVPTKADRRVVRLHQASAQRTPRLPAKVAE